MFESNWMEFNETEFSLFYRKYTKLCEIQKRISYLNCKYVNLDHLELGQREIRNLI